MNKEHTLEYYCRKRNYHGIGTFHQLNDEEIKPGDEFIVPHHDVIYPNFKDNRGNGIAGCCEGREKHPAYLKPLVLVCKSVTDNHVISFGYGAWIKDRVLIENK
jgi:hypothetical protein